MIKILDETKDFVIFKVPASFKSAIKYYLKEDEVSSEEEVLELKKIESGIRRTGTVSLEAVKKKYGIL